MGIRVRRECRVVAGCECRRDPVRWAGVAGHGGIGDLLKEDTTRRVVAGKVESDHGRAIAVGRFPLHHTNSMMNPDRLRMAMVLLGDITQGELSRASGISPTTISLFLNGKRKLRPALASKIMVGLERAFIKKGSRLDTVFFTTDDNS